MGGKGCGERTGDVMGEVVGHVVGDVEGAAGAGRGSKRVVPCVSCSRQHLRARGFMRNKNPNDPRGEEWTKKSGGDPAGEARRHSPARAHTHTCAGVQVYGIAHPRTRKYAQVYRITRPRTRTHAQMYRRTRPRTRTHKQVYRITPTHTYTRTDVQERTPTSAHLHRHRLTPPPPMNTCTTVHPPSHPYTHTGVHAYMLTHTYT